MWWWVSMEISCSGRGHYLPPCMYCHLILVWLYVNRLSSFERTVTTFCAVLELKWFCLFAPLTLANCQCMRFGSLIHRLKKLLSSSDTASHKINTYLCSAKGNMHIGLRSFCYIICFLLDVACGLWKGIVLCFNILLLLAVLWVQEENFNHGEGFISCWQVFKKRHHCLSIYSFC